MEYWEEHRPKPLEFATDESVEFQLGQAKAHIFLLAHYAKYLEKELKDVWNRLEEERLGDEM